MENDTNTHTIILISLIIIVFIICVTNICVYCVPDRYYDKCFKREQQQYISV